MERFEISWWLDAIDLGVFMLEGVLLIAGTIFTGGVLATTAAGAFTQLEVGVGVIKTVVARLPLLWNSASFAMAISHYTAVNTASLGVRM
jgi:hypothetical protein